MNNIEGSASKQLLLMKPLFAAARLFAFDHVSVYAYVTFVDGSEN